MKSSRDPILVLLVAVVAIAGVRMYWESRSREIIPWRADLPAAMAEASRTHKPIFIDFTASWCPPCRAMRGTTWASGDVKSAMETFVPVQIDLDAHPDLAAKYHVEAIPHFFICDADGSPQRSAEGLMDPSTMTGWLARAPH